MKQIVARRGSVNWYEPSRVDEAVLAVHSEYEGQPRSDVSCLRTVRWLPIGEGEVPVDLRALPTGSDVVSSPEIFGDGWKTFRHLLFRRPVAEVLIAANPRSWTIAKITLVTSDVPPVRTARPPIDRPMGQSDRACEQHPSS